MILIIQYLTLYPGINQQSCRKYKGPIDKQKQNQSTLCISDYKLVFLKNPKAVFLSENIMDWIVKLRDLTAHSEGIWN